MTLWVDKGAAGAATSGTSLRRSGRGTGNSGGLWFRFANCADLQPGRLNLSWGAVLYVLRST